ncbi:DUF6233 domain-containing protein [Streptomyces olivaceoviridis]|uniref:DUF6233 domain-containing protein n=1 Tax=Streptomyces olivaceoviridis TaxID=1921 RepID=UPI003329485E
MHSAAGSKGVDSDTARRALAGGVAACSFCRPDTELGISMGNQPNALRHALAGSYRACAWCLVALGAGADCKVGTEDVRSATRMKACCWCHDISLYESSMMVEPFV